MAFFYRFRTIDALLGERQELERQEIYFASPEQLNDPMEGYKDLFWYGDAIVWRNLFQHYLLCLMQTSTLGFLAGKNFKPAMAQNIVFSTQRTLPTEEIKAHYKRICTEFFDTHGIEELPSLIANLKQPIRRDELEFYLRAVHPVAFKCITKVFREAQLIPPANTSASRPDISEEGVVNNLNKVLNTLRDQSAEINAGARRALFFATGHVYRQIDLIKYLSPTDELARAWHCIFYSYPEFYVDCLGELVHSDWYAACFIGDPSHAAMWGNYGDGHKGICLKFSAEEQLDQQVLKMRGIVGWGGSKSEQAPIAGDVVLPIIETVSYTHLTLPTNREV